MNREHTALIDVSHLRKLDLKGAGVPTIPALPDGVDFWQLSPRHALLTGLEANMSEMKNLEVSIVDVTSVFAGFALTGPDSRAILRRLFALDLAENALSDRSCAQSKAAEVHVTICRKDIGNSPQFLLFVGRDVADSFRESVLHAGHSFGLAGL